ncbi:O-methylsterigmatocystin oxidoreductase [Hypsizygus marmoreus]|uniref:O-methylsterigmatocystin oxidoreductase n=1 Tax=Hypsizygus marmoreus TaxID=39966 RepID=A0A369K0J0_HYPMA|nr:O-methylsterigmatocystin oxidoreductase [Hypsizygus marmoreus]
MLDLTTPALVALLALILAVAIRLSQSLKLKAHPPGPPGIVFFGNALQIPKQSPWLKFTEWGTTYGDIVFAKVFSRQLVILNSYDVATQLLEKRSANYSDRPRRFMAELSGFGRTMLFKNYGEDVRKGRRLIQLGFGALDSGTFNTMHTKSAHAFAKFLLDDPDRLHDHIRRALTANLLQFTYGHKVESDDDELVPLSEEVMNITGKLVSPNRYVVDVFPILNSLPEWFPGTGFKRVAREYKDTIDRLMGTPFLKVQEQVKSGTAEPSFTANHLEGQVNTMSESDLEHLKWAAGMINAAGVDTTASVLTSFFLAMARNPDVQSKAQHELDTVLGPDVLPTFADRGRLRFIECIIKECLRWNPPTPLIGRSVRKDDLFGDWVIQAGSFIIVNAWAYTHDPRVYPEPFEFNPSRFLPNDNTPVPPDPRLYIFGLGRRRCPGVDLSSNVLYIMIATTLSLFNVLSELDENGKPKLPEVRYTTTFTSHPLPFKCRIVPRSQETAKAIIYAAES